MTASIHPALTRALNGRRTRALTLDVGVANRYIIFSDQHKGAGDQADEFEVCRATYRAALLYYLQAGHTLILLGDVEELWENSFREVFAQHGEIIDLEAAFGAGRYHRIWGNHDDRWSSVGPAARDLAPRVPANASLDEAIRFSVTDGGAELGTVLILHGHQGTIDSDQLAWIAKPTLRLVWRPIAQNFLGVGRQSPSADVRLRGEHDREMYAWAAAQRKLILIAGHTHRPVWAARNHAQRLRAELAKLERHASPGDPTWDAKVARLKVDIERRSAESPPEFDLPDEGLRPCYFNTGCCKFSDGDITGLEIEGGTLKLVKWAAPTDIDPAQRMELEVGELADFLAEL